MTVVYFLDDANDSNGGGFLFPRGQLRIQPRKGMAVVFHSHLEDGSLDVASLHQMEAVLTGTRWTAVQR